MATKTKDAIALLKEDHKKVKELFKQFEKAESRDEKERLCQTALKELKIHTVIEEEIFYPAMEQLGGETENVVSESEEEHRVAKTLVEDLEQSGPSDEHFEAKFQVLAENVRHHIKEEESELFPKARKSEADLKELGEKLLQRKQQLSENGDELTQAEEQSAIKPYQELAHR